MVREALGTGWASEISKSAQQQDLQPGPLCTASGGWCFSNKLNSWNQNKARSDFRGASEQRHGDGGDERERQQTFIQFRALKMTSGGAYNKSRG